MKTLTLLAAAATVAGGLAATPAYAFRPDFAATPFECSGYDPVARTCDTTSATEFLSGGAGVATSRARLSISPLMLGVPTGTRATFLVAATGPFRLNGDIFCAYDTMITVKAEDPATPTAFMVAVKALYLELFAGTACYTYTEGSAANAVFVHDANSDIARSGPGRPLTLFTMREGAALSLAVTTP